jgi:arylsulfatase A-like enzyme
MPVDDTDEQQKSLSQIRPAKWFVCLLPSPCLLPVAHRCHPRHLWIIAAPAALPASAPKFPAIFDWHWQAPALGLCYRYQTGYCLPRHHFSRADTLTMKRPNIVFIMTDDHAAHAMSCYGSRVNRTPHLDRIAEGGMRFDNCFCTNSICAPSRAAILTGTYNHVNGVTTLDGGMDNRIMTFPRLLQAQGYQTAIFGKWHLGDAAPHNPRGFDRWCVLPGQGDYHDPKLNDQGETKVFPGYATDVITDLSLGWLKDRDPERPFMLLCHHKAPHRPWDPDEKHAKLYEDEEIPYPPTFDDDYEDRGLAAKHAEMTMWHLNARDLKQPVPPGLSRAEEKKWRYQRYMKDYLRCVASVDDNVGRLLDYLEAEGLREDTIVVYTSDQGFFLGDHGWYDKRFMYEECLRMPFLIQYPRRIQAGTVNQDILLNVDFAPTFLEYAGVTIPSFVQGVSATAVLAGATPPGWRKSMYYRYWMHGSHHHVHAHYGVRTERYKLIYYYNDCLDQVRVPRDAEGKAPAAFDQHAPEWELFDLHQDGGEMRNVYHDPAYQTVVRELKTELTRLQAEVGDVPYPGQD